MILYLIRHGEPNYETDTLTEKGKKEAEYCSERMVKSGLHRIYSSPMGRAKETAAPTAEKLGLSVEIEPWAYELGEESKTFYPDGKWKTISVLPTTFLHGDNFSLQDENASVQTLCDYLDNEFRSRYEELTLGIDSLLEKNGYKRRTDGFYDITNPNEDKIALFCHCGMMRVVLAHLLHIPFNLLASTMISHYTGITILEFTNERCGIVSPRLLSYGDIGHLYPHQDGPVDHYFIHKDI